jgi:exosortase A-associated hydrolase 1
MTEQSIKEEALEFLCQGQSLLGVLHAPQPPSRGTGIVVVVGGPQYRVGSHRQFVSMSRGFAAAGFPVLRFDYRGMGDSEGEAPGFDNVGDDIRAAIDAFLHARPELSGVVLLGLCDAASASLIYGGSDERVAGMLLLNPWVRTPVGQAKANLQHYYAKRLLQRSFWEKVLSGHGEMRASLRDLWSSWRSSRSIAAVGALPSFVERMARGLAEVQRPIMVILSERDLTAREYEDLCRSSPDWAELVQRKNVETVAVPAADHTFSSSDALRAAMALSLAWLSSVEKRECDRCRSSTGDRK